MDGMVISFMSVAIFPIPTGTGPDTPDIRQGFWLSHYQQLSGAHIRYDAHEVGSRFLGHFTTGQPYISPAARYPLCTAPSM
jgi:hypothetical protein